MERDRSGPTASPRPRAGATHPLNQLPSVKVLLVDLSKRYGGASTRALTLAKGLADWQAGIAALEGSPVSQAAQREGVPVITVGASRVDPRIPFRLAKAIRTGNFQVVDTQNIQSKFWGSMAARLSGAALVSTLNSSYLNEHGGNWKGRLYTLLDRATDSNAARYIAVSESIRAWLCERGIAEDHVDLIRNGIQIPDGGDANERADLRRTLRLPDDAILCTAVGRLVWAKGYMDLITAFRQVNQEVANAYCLIVGDGELRPAMEDEIRRLGISKHVLLLGYREHAEALKILRASDIFVMPSRSEGIPYALLEAGALGLPILATRCGGIPEVVRDGTDGVLVEPADVAGIANALEALCKDPQKAKQFGREARKRVRQDFSLETELELTKQAYLKAVGTDIRVSM